MMDVPGVRHYAGEAQRLADRTDRADLWADALAWNGSAQAAEGDVAGAIRSDRTAVARAGGIRSFALARVPLTLYWAGRTAEAVEQSCRAVERARESNDAAFLLYALQHRGLSLAGAGETGSGSHIRRGLRVRTVLRGASATGSCDVYVGLAVAQPG